MRRIAAVVLAGTLAAGWQSVEAQRGQGTGRGQQQGQQQQGQGQQGQQQGQQQQGQAQGQQTQGQQMTQLLQGLQQTQTQQGARGGRGGTQAGRGGRGGSTSQQPIPPGEFVFRFQLIEALPTSASDPQVSPEVLAVLADLFSFRGYRLLSQAAVLVDATQQNGSASQLLRGGGQSFSLDINVESLNRYDANVGALVEIALSSVHANDQGSIISARSVLSTKVTVISGRTVVLGSSQPGDAANALILTVRPQWRQLSDY